jgi:hypothetical protein
MNHRIRIIDIDDASEEKWLEICEACEYSTFFHTPQWANLYYVYTERRVKPTPRIITFEDKSRAIILLSRENFFRGLLKKYISSPAGTFGGWISADLLTIDHTRAMLDYMLKLPDLFWRENPYDPFLRTLPIPGAADEFTQTIDLTQSPESLQKSISRAHAKALRKAIREEVTIHESCDLADWKQHFSAYESSLNRWKKNGTLKKSAQPYSWKMFELLFISKSPHIKLWYARYKGNLAASVLCFYWKHHAVAWHGAALEEFFNVRPNNLLYQHMIDHAKKCGYRWFDCNTPGGLSGVVEFKDNLGTQHLSSRLVDKASPVRNILRKIRRTL